MTAAQNRAWCMHDVYLYTHMTSPPSLPCSHLASEHQLNHGTRAQTKVQALVVEQLEKQVGLVFESCLARLSSLLSLQLGAERERLGAMKKHLNLSSCEVDALTTSVTPEQLANGGMAHVATPTSSPAPPMKTPHSVAMPTPVLQAVYDRNSQQPLYILQSSNGPTLIPVQGIQMGPPRGGGGAGCTAIPTSLSIEQLGGKGGVASIQGTPTPGTPKPLSFSPGGFGGGLEGLMQPSPLLMPQTNGGMQLSEAGPIRTIVRQAAKERPSPVAMDGEQL